MPLPLLDPKNFTSIYNTQLAPQEEQAFQNWMWNNSQTMGRSLWPDLYDYDLRGFFKSGGNIGKGHLTDEFKKPNHPTFSNQSVYSGVDGYLGGQWLVGPNGKWGFYPGPTNVHSLPDLQQYFQRVEPDSVLIAPTVTK